MIPMLVGTALALAALLFVLYPLFQEPLGIDATPARGARVMGTMTAIDALREIEFDHATGKLSESDYAELKASYTQRAVADMRTGPSGAVICERCGPRPEPDAQFCSECGRLLAA
jgi:hypothetical protein